VSAIEFVLYLGWAVFTALFVRLVAQAVHQPWKVNIDIVLLFAAPMLSTLLGLGGRLGLLPPASELRNITTALLLVIAAQLFRLADEFSGVPRWARRLISWSTLLLALVLAASTPPPLWLQLTAFVVVIAVLLYGAFAFLRAARQSSGVTHRRMQAVAAGSLLFVGAFAVAAPVLAFPNWRDTLVLLANLCGFAAGVSYFVGFSPPRWLRRAWQEPELRAFLGRAARLPRLPDTGAIIGALEQGTAESLGVPAAHVGLWDEDARALRFRGKAGDVWITDATPGAVTRMWQTGRALFVLTRSGSDPSAELLGHRATAAALIAPIMSGATRLGLLAVFAPRAPLFADADLALLCMLADQAAVVLESRRLIDEAARVRAREEAARLKDDFLSAAAHDLKTPLTTLVGRAQLMERRALRDPAAPADLLMIQSLVREGLRLRRLVHELLDAARAERGLLIGTRGDVELVALAESVCARYDGPHHRCHVIAEGPLVGWYDEVRIEQLLDNLVENAVKYSPEGGEVCIEISSQGQQALITVADQGIGIPPADLPRIFDRFYRGANANGPYLSGMGLGLFICRAIVEQHGGVITAESSPGRGTTFRIALPLLREQAAAYV
jgi:signal transduction histidine kinase